MRLVGLSGLVLALVSPLAAQTRGQVASKPGSNAASRTVTQTAVFAGGCFWGIEAVFEHTKGVVSAVSGYSGGSLVSPSYEQVGQENTGHAESVRVTYDPRQVSYQQLLEGF